jgi:ABC-type glycerol-3-phosphate transport system substrate-binding protein
MVHLLETALLGSLGADAYVGLWSGATGWGSAEVTTALNNFNRMLNYVNEDYAALSWDRAAQLVIDGSAAMNIMGNWAKGYFKSQGWTPGVEFGWMPSPGSAGAFDALSDSFGLPKGAPNRDAAIAWLKVCGSKEGQALLCCSLGTLQTRKSSFLAVGLSRRLPHNSLVFSLRLRCRVTVVRPRRPPAMGPCGLVRGSWPRNAQESCSRYAGKSPQFKG